MTCFVDWLERSHVAFTTVNWWTRQVQQKVTARSW